LPKSGVFSANIRSKETLNIESEDEISEEVTDNNNSPSVEVISPDILIALLNEAFLKLASVMKIKNFTIHSLFQNESVVKKVLTEYGNESEYVYITPKDFQDKLNKLNVELTQNQMKALFNNLKNNVIQGSILLTDLAERLHKYGIKLGEKLPQKSISVMKSENFNSSQNRMNSSFSKQLNDDITEGKYINSAVAEERKKPSQKVDLLEKQPSEDEEMYPEPDRLKVEESEGNGSDSDQEQNGRLSKMNLDKLDREHESSHHSVRQVSADI